MIVEEDVEVGGGARVAGCKRKLAGHGRADYGFVRADIIGSCQDFHGLGAILAAIDVQP